MPNRRNIDDRLPSSTRYQMLNTINNHNNNNGIDHHHHYDSNTSNRQQQQSSNNKMTMIIDNHNDSKRQIVKNSRIPIYDRNHYHYHHHYNHNNNGNILAINNFLSLNDLDNHNHNQQSNHVSNGKNYRTNNHLIVKNLSNIRLMDLPDEIRINQNLHNHFNHHFCHRQSSFTNSKTMPSMSQQLNLIDKQSNYQQSQPNFINNYQQKSKHFGHNQQQHQQQQLYQQKFLRPKISNSLPSTPGSSTPKIEDDNNSIMSTSTMTTNTNKSSRSCGANNGGRKQQKQSKNTYDEYLPLCEMQKGLEKGEIVEGILRINQRNYNDAYITAPNEKGLDIYIKDLINRNRALNGDVVAVQLLDENEWKISYSIIDLNWSEWKQDFEQLILSKNDDIDLSKLKLNSKDKKLINMACNNNASSSPSTSEESKILLQNEFENLPLEIFALEISEIKQNISYWTQMIQCTGKVVGILEKKHSRMIAVTMKLDDEQSFKKINDDGYLRLMPNDIRNPPIIVKKKELPKFVVQDPSKYKNHLFLAKINEWKSDSLYPNGEIVKNVGEIGDINAETELMLFTFNINYDDFPREALEEYEKIFPNKDWKIPETEIEKRKDLRNDCIFTIDPETARDLDDAISYRQLSDDRFEIGVHIADVSYFIKEDTMLDRIAQDRATSVYLVSKVIPMLPELFCQELCSLNPGDDKLTFSAIITLDNNGQIIDRWFGRTIINSCCKLTYELAQKLIDCENEDELDISLYPPIRSECWSLSDIGNRVRNLHRIAKILRKNRQEAGSIRLDKTRITFLLDEQNLPFALTKYELRQSNWLIEELMLLANRWVAEFLYDKFAHEGRAFLRWHPTIDKFLLSQFLKSIKDICPIEFKCDCSQSIIESLHKLSQIDTNFCQISTMFLIKAMKLAMYTCVSDQDDPSTYRHFALNFQKYTHFTSPIRRYADIIVHRLLSVALDDDNGDNISKCTKSKEELKKIAANCNTRKYNSMLASEKSIEIHLKSYIKTIGSFQSKAIVFQIYDHSFDVLILALDIINRVYLDQLYIDHFEFIVNDHKRKLKLHWKESDSEKIDKQLQHQQQQNGISSENNNRTNLSLSLIQSIESFMIVDIEITITDKFEMKTIIAHPNGKFIPRHG